jgi:hypothetical protein
MQPVLQVSNGLRERYGMSEGETDGPDWKWAERGMMGWKWPTA